MNDAFSKTYEIMGAFLTYSDIYGKKPKLQEVIDDIRKIELKKALTIISNFSLYTQEQTKEIVVSKLSSYITNPLVLERLESTYLFDVSNLYYSMKMFIAHGTEKPFYEFNNSFGDHMNILNTILKISDLMQDDVGNDIQVQQTIQKLRLINRENSSLVTLARQHLFFEEIAKNQSQNNEFVDIHKYFKEEYGYTIGDYISVLATITLVTENEHPTFDKLELIGIPLNYFNSLSPTKQQVAETILNDLVADFSLLKNQAKASLDNIYDNEFLINKPLFVYDNHYVLFSLPLLNLGLFDSLCFKLQRICRKHKQDFFTFFGRLYEKYVEYILDDVVKKAIDKNIPYEFIPEYKYTEGKNSSDAFIRLGNKLLIIECKGGRITKEAKINANLKDTEKNFQKYAVEPLKQANKAYKDILIFDPNKFRGVKKVYIFSVALQRFPKLPMYHDRLKDEVTDLHPTVVEYDYMSLSDLEAIAAYIENQNKSVFRFIDNKKIDFEYYSYEEYYARKNSIIHFLSLHKQMFDKSTDQIISTFRSQ